MAGTASRVFGGRAGGVALRWVWHQSACHSVLESHSLAGAAPLSGARPARFSARMRAATMTQFAGTLPSRLR